MLGQNFIMFKSNFGSKKALTFEHFQYTFQSLIFIIFIQFLSQY